MPSLRDFTQAAFYRDLFRNIWGRSDDEETHGASGPSIPFKECLPFVLQWEGGYVNHPRDPGGATNKGVTQRVYDAWRRQSGHQPRSVLHIESWEAENIYEEMYWKPALCGLLPGKLPLVQFDTAVNMGVYRATKFLQRSVGAKEDGIIGPVTRESLSLCNPVNVSRKYLDTRVAYYKSRPHYPTFKNGWINRVNSLADEIGLDVRYVA